MLEFVWFSLGLNTDLNIYSNLSTQLNDIYNKDTVSFTHFIMAVLHIVSLKENCTFLGMWPIHPKSQDKIIDAFSLSVLSVDH